MTTRKPRDLASTLKAGTIDHNTYWTNVKLIADRTRDEAIASLVLMGVDRETAEALVDGR